MPSTRVKVSREALIESIEARRAEAVAEHEKRVADYAGKQANYASAVEAALERALGAVRSGKGLPKSGYSGLTVPIKASEPTEPAAKPNTSKYDRDIALLKMGTEDTLSLTAEALEAYVR